MASPAQFTREQQQQQQQRQRHASDWAPDRSPLQKLEVTLSGMSKEEKRARVQEAEMKLKERLALLKSYDSDGGYNDNVKYRGGVGGGGGGGGGGGEESEPEFKRQHVRQKPASQDSNISVRDYSISESSEPMTPSPEQIARASSSRVRSNAPSTKGDIKLPKRGDPRGRAPSGLPGVYSQKRGREATGGGRGGQLERPKVDNDDSYTTIATHHARSRSLNVGNYGYAVVESARQPQFATADYPTTPVENRYRIPRRPVGAAGQSNDRQMSNDGMAATARALPLPQSKATPIIIPISPTKKTRPQRLHSIPTYHQQGSRDSSLMQQPAQENEHYKTAAVDAQHSGTNVAPFHPPPLSTNMNTDIAERDFASLPIRPGKQVPLNADDNNQAFATQDSTADVDNNEQGQQQQQQQQQQQNVRTKSKKQQTVSFDVPPSTPPPLFEWKNAPVARLRAFDFDFRQIDLERSKAWWQRGKTSNRRESRGLPRNYYQKPVQPETSNDRFDPRIFLKCGPLLRYAGIKHATIDGPNGPFQKETWRGSIMIVTKDSRSSYEQPPMLRLFPQPMELLPPPPLRVENQLAFEYVDPTAGLMKIGRDGRPVYVKPVDDTEEGVDLSAVENDDGLFELSPSRIEFSGDAQQSIPANRIHTTDGETVGVYREIPGIRLYADPDRDVTFWRFQIEIELGSEQQRVAYRINKGPAVGFWVPARGESMNIAYYTGNGFGSSVDSSRVSGPDPLWRDILNEHQTRPFHVMIGGGDQIFNDSITKDTISFQEWVKIKNVQDKYNTPFDPKFRSEIEGFFLERYSNWFSAGLYSLANSQIPMVNIWNDHEIIEGYGSYPDEFMRTAVISGLGRIAFKYYLLFQHQSVPEETDEDEPSWLLGVNPGPYIKQRSRNLFMSLGKDVSLLALDCRTERISSEILSEETCDLIWDRCHRELVKGEVKHLLVLSSIPIAYPRVAMVKNILNSRKSLGKAGVFGGLLNKHGGRVEIFDDHWTAKHLKAERGWLIEDLQDLAAEKSIRVTILSGDVHLAAIGRFYSNPKLDMPKDRDYRYMPNIISSAIADIPETEMISDMLNMSNRVHHMDHNTDEDIIPIFTQDVDGKTRTNKRLLPRRNWCSVRAYQPGSTPPATPEPVMDPDYSEGPRPTKLQRTLSLTRGDRLSGGGLIRRLSQRGSRPPTREFNLAGADRRRMSMDGPFPPPETGDSYFAGQQPDPDPRPNPFLRRPTDHNPKAAFFAAAKHGESSGAGAPISLEGGLAVTLNMEVNPKDPSGITNPYKLLVPMLRYEDGLVHADNLERDPGNGFSNNGPNTNEQLLLSPSLPKDSRPKRSWTRWLRLGMNRKKDFEEEGELGYDEDDNEDDNEDGFDEGYYHGAGGENEGNVDVNDYEGYPGSDDDVNHEFLPEAPVHMSGQQQQPKRQWFRRM